MGTFNPKNQRTTEYLKLKYFASTSEEDQKSFEKILKSKSYSFDGSASKKRKAISMEVKLHIMCVLHTFCTVLLSNPPPAQQPTVSVERQKLNRVTSRRRNEIPTYLEDPLYRHELLLQKYGF